MRKLLFIAVFVSGLTSLALEMAASRLLGNYFGTSNLVWASIIGLILIYLTAGYFIGGRLADRSPYYQTFYKILAWAGFTIAITPLASRPLLRFAADAFDQLELGVLAGSFTVVMILFIIPVTLLGMASPFAIRLSITDSRQAGSIAGRISAISTLGSFIGTFLPTLVLIPWVGTYRTFLVIAGLEMLVGLIGLWVSTGWKKTLIYAWMPVILVILAVLGVRGFDKASQGQIYEAESAYNYIQVLEQDGYRMLRLNEGQGVHSMYHPEAMNFNGPWEQVLVAPFFNPSPYNPAQVQRMAIVGLAAGTTARQATAVFDGIQIDGIEIDPVIVDVARKYFDMNEPNLNVIVQDGRWGLEHSPHDYQVISVDAYRPPYIPWHLTTVEFFQIVHDHLTADGVMVINVGRAPGDRRMIDDLGSTIREVFPSVHAVDVPGSFNTILFATKQPTHPQNLKDNFDAMLGTGETPMLLLESMYTALNNLQDPPGEGMVFTDDHAPVEMVTNSMVLNFFFNDEMETLE